MATVNARRMGIVVGVLLLAGAAVQGRDWPQWRGPNRDARATAFTPPAAWPKELTQKWKVSVGDGVATPSLAADRLYVIALQGGNEVARCLDAATGKELWQDKYPTQGATGPAAPFPGTRSSPTVADGKVVTLGVRGILSCYDAQSGKKLWRKEDFANNLPRFFTSCSPLVVEGMCIVQLGGEGGGGIVAYDLATGNERWKWTGEGTAYSSPVLSAAAGGKALIAETSRSLVALSLADGKLLWQTPWGAQGRSYNAATPIVEGDIVLGSGSGLGTKAFQLAREGEKLAAKELWSNPQNSVQFNTPVVKNGLIFGISANDVLFCLTAKDGQTAWTSPMPAKGGRFRGYGSVVDAGTALVALTPAGQLVVFEPNAKEFKQIASYKVAERDTFAYPVLSGKRIFIKDRDSVALWTVE